LHRFFVSSESLTGEKVHLPAHVSEQLSRVLRAKNGDEVILLDSSGLERFVRLDSVERHSCVGTVVKTVEGKGEPTVSVSLYQALIKSDRFEYALQKGVEVGVSRFVPFISERTEVESPSKPRLTRWRRIIREAAEQSGRSILPQLEMSGSLNFFLKSVSGAAIIPWEQENIIGIRHVLAEFYKNEKLRCNEVSVFIGPVGGFTPDEIHLAQQSGVIPVSLGNRILRAETAGVAAALTILYEAGEMGLP
jgi:16S rRNA (uracil1498-N3)-methyltransferase